MKLSSPQTGPVRSVPADGTFGRPCFADINTELNKAFSAHGTLIAAHRGAPRGDILENTLNSVKATRFVGADIAEIDIIRTTDGEYFAFHDGFEYSHLRCERSVLEMTAEELAAIRYSDFQNTYYGFVERAGFILGNLPQILVNVDRSWRYWSSGFLDWLDGFGLERWLILKSPVNDEYVSALRGHGVKYMYMPMIWSMQELESVADDPDINVVGAELIEPHVGVERFTGDDCESLHRRGMYAFVNALGLGNDNHGFQGISDATAVLEGPDAGWGRLMEFGADIIQTDWPEMLRFYRDGIFSRSER